MVLEEEIQPYYEWLFGTPQRSGALLSFAEAAFFVLLAALAISYLVCAFRYGPLAAGDIVYRAVVGAAIDLARISPRRIWALSRLAVQEAIRRRVWVALVAFGVILMFAGWFLDPQSPAPGPLYLTFVLSWTTYLVVLLALFISTFSLPADIKNRTIYTVVTKPVRSGEIVLGRVIGFTLVGTALLAVMGLSSYVFVVRALDHTHELRVEDLRDLPLRVGEALPRKVGTTRIAQNHQHDVELDADGNGLTDFKHGHFHRITAETVDGKTRYLVGPHQDMLTARVPLSGKLRFLDRDGQPGKGISVGKEWDYRGFLEGGSLAAAVWTFENVDEDSLFGPDVAPEDRTLPLDMTVRVFRTHKGNIEKGVTGSLALRNPETQLQSEPIIFSAKEFAIDRPFIPRKQPKAGAAPGDAPIDVYQDLVHNGRLEVIVRCLEPGQYYGAAAADMYLRSGDASFELNFLKGYLGIWFQMVLVIAIGVMFSTFLSGAVAMLATLGCIVMGFFTGFIGDLFTSVITDNRKIMAGGGPIEAFIRLVTQKAITVPYEDSFGIQIVYWVDKVLLRGLKAWTDLLPNFGSFSDVNFVARGFDVPGDLILEQATRMAAYLLAAFLAGFMFFRMREVAR